VVSAPSVLYLDLSFFLGYFVSSSLIILFFNGDIVMLGLTICSFLTIALVYHGLSTFFYAAHERECIACFIWAYVQPLGITRISLCESLGYLTGLVNPDFIYFDQLSFLPSCFILQ
jgi:hypothetical protein